MAISVQQLCQTFTTTNWYFTHTKCEWITMSQLLHTLTLIFDSSSNVSVFMLPICLYLSWLWLVSVCKQNKTKPKQDLCTLATAQYVMKSSHIVLHEAGWGRLNRNLKPCINATVPASRFNTCWNWLNYWTCLLTELDVLRTYISITVCTTHKCVGR